jgi:hypothetical protein
VAAAVQDDLQTTYHRREVAKQVSFVAGKESVAAGRSS